jgi:hypothetical protein
MTSVRFKKFSEPKVLWEGIRTISMFSLSSCSLSNEEGTDRGFTVDSYQKIIIDNSSFEIQSLESAISHYNT